MRIEITIDEAREIAQASGKYPNSLTSVTADGDDIRFVIDLRLLPDAPGAIKLAARLVPLVRGSLHVVDFTAGTLVLGLHVGAAGLPAEKLLGLAEGPIVEALRKRGLPEDSVRVLGGGKIALDAQVLLGEFVGELLPEAQISEVQLAGGVLTVTAGL